jgi:hypothetical protein
MKTNVPGNDCDGTSLTASNFALLSRRGDMDEKKLRIAQNRFLMHRSYAGGTEDEWAKSRTEAQKLE